MQPAINFSVSCTKYYSKCMGKNAGYRFLVGTGVGGLGTKKEMSYTEKATLGNIIIFDTF